MYFRYAGVNYFGLRFDFAIVSAAVTSCMEGDVCFVCPNEAVLLQCSADDVITARLRVGHR